MKKSVIKFIPFFIMASFLVTGCSQDTSSTTTAAKPAAGVQAQKTESKVYQGKIKGKSNKAKTISISVGKGEDAKTIMVKFGDDTKGVKYAKKGSAAIISYQMRNGEPWATEIKPKLAKLPKGVANLKLEEFLALMDSGTEFVLIDARPKKPFAQAHLPGAISIGTKEYKKIASSVLPKNKDILLVAY